MAKSKTKNSNKSTSALKWAAAIITLLAIIIYLFPGESGPGPGCIQFSGFYCSMVGYSSSNGNMTLVITQNTGSNWSDVQITPVLLSSYSPNESSTYWNSTNVIKVGEWNNEQQIKITVKADVSAQNEVLLASYKISNNESLQYSQIANLRLR